MSGCESPLILIADDSPLFREIESLFLSRTGRVVTASDGVQALALARREPPSVAIIDLAMPGMSGDHVCRLMKADPQLHEIPVVLVLSEGKPDERERAVRSGADDVIAKPLNRLTLNQAVKRCLRAPQTPGLARVPLETRVHLQRGAQDAWGTSRNLSRGGMFVQLAEPLQPDTEVQLHFNLPDSPREIAPTAVVVWRRDAGHGTPPGMGLQFLRVDRSSVERIDDFVYQNAAAARRSSGSLA